MRFLSQRGFTLIELLVWLVMVVGILFSLFVLTSCDREPNPELESILYGNSTQQDHAYKEPEEKPEQPVRDSKKNGCRLNDDDNHCLGVVIFSLAECIKLQDNVLYFNDQLFKPPAYKKIGTLTCPGARGFVNLETGLYEEPLPLYDTCNGGNIHDTLVRFCKVEPWIKTLGQQKSLKKVLQIIHKQFLELNRRLGILHGDRQRLIKKYNDNSFVGPIDKDIKELSSKGMRLAKVAKRFFVAVKPKLIQLDVAATRQKALAGLRTFENEIDAAQTTSSQSLDDIIANIDQAVKKLERAINQ